MSRKGYINLSIILMFASAIMISLAFVYYALEDRAISYRYSDIKEYTDINNGIKFIEKMPIQFNIINKYFLEISIINVFYFYTIVFYCRSTWSTIKLSISIF